MRIHELTTVDGFIAFDFDCPVSGGGTRMAPDVTRGETILLARAMTYKLAILRQPIGGAKAAIRAGQEDREAVLARYCAEIAPMVEREEFLTASDLGTRPEDFASLENRPSLLHAEDESGTSLNTVITGLGAVAAAAAALGDLSGRALALEGFGKVGGAVAAEAARRGARVIATSTVHGAVTHPAGFDVGRLLELRARHGDRLVEHLGVPVLPTAALFEIEADVLVPGARTGVLDAARAVRVRTKVVAPAANAPYTARGLAALHERGVLALADFVCNAGATMGYLAERAGRAGRMGDAQALRADVEQQIHEATTATLGHPDGPFAGACAAAEEFLRTWRPPDGMPDRPPLAPN